MQQLASDNFQRANESPLNPAIWTIASGLAGDGCQIVSDLAEAQSITAAGVELYSGIVWPSDQYSKVQVKSCNASGLLSAIVRGQPGSLSFYAFGLTGATGSSAPIELEVFNNGVPVTLASGTAAVNPNDFLSLMAQGSMLICMINNMTSFAVVDSTFSSGRAGILVNSGVALTDAQAESWSGGGTFPTMYPTNPALSSPAGTARSFWF